GPAAVRVVRTLASLQYRTPHSQGRRGTGCTERAANDGRPAPGTMDRSRVGNPNGPAPPLSPGKYSGHTGVPAKRRRGGALPLITTAGDARFAAAGPVR